MRRPLCLVCMAFVAAVFIMLHIQPMQGHALSEEQEGQVVYLFFIHDNRMLAERAF